MKILTVTINASIDKSYEIPGLKLGIVQKPQNIMDHAGGKGINVSRVLNVFGINSTSLCTIGGMNGKYIKNSLSNENFDSICVEIKKESRLCLTFLDTEKKQETVINEYGKKIDREDIDKFLKHYKKIISDYDIAVISGSVQRDVPSSIYAEMIRIAGKNSVKIFLDASKNELKNAIKERPFFVSPNTVELKEAFKLKSLNIQTLKKTLRKMNKTGVEIPIVTLGKKGALCLFEGKFYRSIPPQIEAVSPIGCGDSFVAGFIYGWINKMDIKECLKYATAASAANAMNSGAGFIKMNEIKKHLKNSSVKII